MDIAASPRSLLVDLHKLQSKEAVEHECIQLIKEHYRSNPQVVLEECVHQGQKLGRPDMIAAAFAIAPKLTGLRGCEHLPRDLKEKWLDQITLSACPENMLGNYVDLCLGGDVSALWASGVGGYKSYLRMWFDLSLSHALPMALEFIETHPGKAQLPPEETLSLLNSLEGVPFAKAAGIVEKLPLEAHAKSIGQWLSKQANKQTFGCAVVVAPHFPNHEIWHSPDFWIVCSASGYPPAFERLVQVLPEKELDRFTEMMSGSTANDLWQNAIGARRAHDQAIALECDGQEALPSRPASRL